MYFDKFWQVDDVEDPYYHQDVKIFKGRGLTNADYGQFVQSSTNVLLHNITVQAFLSKVQDITPTDLQDILGKGQVSLDWDRLVIVCDPIGTLELDPEKIHSDQVLQVQDVRMRNKIIAAQLKDFSCFSMFSLTPTPKDELPEGVGYQACLKIKPNIDFEQAIVYRFPFLYW